MIKIMADSRTRVWALVLLALLLIGISGCRHETVKAFALEPRPARKYQPKLPSRNAFDTYMIEGASLAQLDDKWLFRDQPTPQQKKQIYALTKKSVDAILRATSKACEFQFDPVGPFESRPEQIGWRMFGKVMKWQIADAAAEKNYGRVDQLFLAATKFGFDLSGGAVDDAILGYVIANEARVALLQVIDQHGAGQLNALVNNLSELERNIPSPDQTLENEGENWKVTIGEVQNLAVQGKLDVLNSRLQKAGVEAIDTFTKAQKKDKNFLDEAMRNWSQHCERTVAQLQQDAAMPTAERKIPPEPKSKPPAWVPLAELLQGSGQPYLEMRDLILARTRLLIAYSAVLSKVKVTNQTPDNLNFLGQKLLTDPYSGSGIVYHAQGTEFQLYCIGKNRVDDGGRSAESYSDPDVLLEKP